MSTRQRDRHPEPARGSDGTPEDRAARRRDRFDAASRVAAVADSAIDRCLSEDSEEFLRVNRQRGGQ